MENQSQRNVVKAAVESCLDACGNHRVIFIDKSECEKLDEVNCVDELVVGQGHSLR